MTMIATERAQSAMHHAPIASTVASPARSSLNELRAEGVTKRFGGVTAVNNVSLTLQPGQVHGLIGTNGSGKTTMLNLLSGYYPADEGSISLAGQKLTHAPVQRRPHVGIARTFQKPRLLGTLSVLDNVMLGGWKDTRAGFLSTAFALGRAGREERMLRERAAELLHGIGLGHLMHRKANLLDHAEQRFLEIARGLTMQPRYILMDEPAGGLTEHEIEQLAQIVTTIRDCQVGVLIVEHHTDFVFRISHRVTALNLGQMLKEGTPDEVRNDPEVIRVYLGA
ncbi:ABC transporter ATP-binding protein [Variovorax sp. Sphag1AA]|uniref:ABC transporter ATP-binding protein n=1 Tax=Variovorax sp. Sphag1AA TaxID=2587027 RepID=UPI0017E70296|nr:ABC transporter ATP-binding protein [Variovorax sp. Sphag1AA]MBB3181027.1 branched-chain amino acid transport system ATP-binding protein [Variovorax sp. Sphag1AA]